MVLTRDGRAHLERRLVEVRREEAVVVARLKDERSEEDAATQQRLATEAGQLEDALRRSLSVDDVGEDPEVVEMGDEVAVELPDGDIERFAVVHPLEAPMDDFRISVESPLARAVLGRRPGERVTVSAPGGVYGCRIVERRRLT